MKHPQDIVRQPLMTEKTHRRREATSVYCFRVHVNASKIEIAKAIETLFIKDKIKVADVRTQRVRGKVKRMGRFLGKRPDWKKAWIQLAPGSKEIDIFEAS